MKKISAGWFLKLNNEEIKISVARKDSRLIDWKSSKQIKQAIVGGAFDLSKSATIDLLWIPREFSLRGFAEIKREAIEASN